MIQIINETKEDFLTFLLEGIREGVKDLIKQIETRHLDTVKELVPVQTQSSALSLVKKLCNEIEDLCNGIFYWANYRHVQKIN